VSKSFSFRSSRPHSEIGTHNQPIYRTYAGIHLQDDGKWIVKCPCGYESKSFSEREAAMQSRGGHNAHCKLLVKGVNLA
jgi:hypothetical protein